MGLNFSKPYIIDEVDTEDDYSDVSLIIDKPRCDDYVIDHSTNVISTQSTNNASAIPTSVDVESVQLLTANMDRLLNHLSNHDYQAAYNTAMLLKAYESQDVDKSIHSMSTIMSTTSIHCDHKQTFLDVVPSILDEDERTSTDIGCAIHQSHSKQQINSAQSNYSTNSEEYYLQLREDRFCHSQSPQKNVTKRLTSRSPTRSGIPLLLKTSHIGSSLTSMSRSMNNMALSCDDAKVESERFKLCMSGRGLEETDSALEVTASKISGRVKKSKKRHAIPMNWQQVGDVVSTMSSTTSSSVVCSAATLVCQDPATSITMTDLMEGKVLDLRRWLCMSRPHYKMSSGVSSLVSCWNYLFSYIGGGSLQPITQEQTFHILGFQAPYEDICFGQFTSNRSVMRWFYELNIYFGVNGQCGYMYKPQGRNHTSLLTDDNALSTLKAGLQDSNTSFIYHCQNHYFCPIGYEDVPFSDRQSYSGQLPHTHTESWILIGEPSQKQPTIICKRWKDICIDLKTQNPEYFDIRNDWKGLLYRQSKKVGGNLHCIMIFQRMSNLSLSVLPNLVTTSKNDSPKQSNIIRSSSIPVRNASRPPKSPCVISTNESEGLCKIPLSNEVDTVNNQVMGEEESDDSLEDLNSDVDEGPS